MEHAHGKAVFEQLAPLTRELRTMIPGVYTSFRDLHGAAMAPGALDAKTKELIALALSVQHQCDGCIASHARGAAKAGATKQEAAEALGVTFLMNGGPATIYAPRAYDAFCEFADT
jgi:AhpD family alkylhydroperoxidase